MNSKLRIFFRSTALRLLFTLSMVLIAAPRSFAHALLLDSTPKRDSLVAGPAITFDLRFNSRIDSKRSRLTLVTPDGKLYPLSIAAQHAPDTLTAPAKDLTAGGYKLRWQVLAADGHISRGEVPFKVK